MLYAKDINKKVGIPNLLFHHFTLIKRYKFKGCVITQLTKRKKKKTGMKRS